MYGDEKIIVFFFYLLSFLIACSKKTVEGNKTHAIIYLIFFKLNK